jgi:hypothetical protein
MGVKVQGLRDVLVAEWVRAAAVEHACGASRGACRAIKAYGERDVQEVMAAVAGAAELGPEQGAGVWDAWQGWYPRYVSAEVKRMLPELVARWPTVKLRKKREAQRQKRERWCRDGEAFVRTMGAEPWSLPVLRTMLGLKRRRFEALLTVLVKIGAVRRLGRESALAVASPEWSREQMQALSPSL